MAATLDELIRDVRSASDDVLVQLEAAAGRAGELAELGDALLTHFVDRCRRSGHTWAEIGAHLGVTRQAVQKRFVDAVGAGVSLERFTLRARQVLDRAQAVATDLQHSYVGTEHVLLALFDDREALGAMALDRLGVTRADVERFVLGRTGRGSHPAAGTQPFTPRARKVLEEAVNAALDLGHNYVGTEHLLLGLYRGQDGLAKQALEHLGAGPKLARDAVVSLLASRT